MRGRRTYAALLTEQGRYARAAQLYEEDLSLFPKNPWALAGLERCFGALADGRHAEAAAALREAQQSADVPIRASCACAKKHWGGD